MFLAKHKNKGDVMSDDKNLQSGFNHAAAHAQPVRIETPRLILRETTQADTDAFRDITSCPGFYYYCFDGSEEKLKAFIDTSVDSQTPDPVTGLRSMFMLAVVLKDTNEVIGHASLLRISEYTLPVSDVDYEAAYFIDNRHAGKAYGQEALLNTMHYGFAKLGLPGLGSMQELDNAQAIKLARDVLGFKKVGEGIGQTVKGPKQHQICLVTPQDFYTLRKTDKRTYIAPVELQSALARIDSTPPAP